MANERIVANEVRADYTRRVQASNPEAQLRTLRIIYAGIGASAITYPLVAERLAQSGRIEMPAYAMLSMVAVALGIASIMLRRNMLSKAERLSELGERERAMRLWVVGHIVPFCLAEAVVLFGFVVRFLGATLKQAVPLYALGIAVLLMNAPQRFEGPGN